MSIFGKLFGRPEPRRYWTEDLEKLRGLPDIPWAMGYCKVCGRVACILAPRFGSDRWSLHYLRESSTHCACGSQVYTHA